MKRPLFFTLATALLMASLQPAVTQAGNRNGAFSISPTIGGITFEGDQHLESSPVFGGRLGYNFTGALGLELLFDYSKTEGTNAPRNVDIYRYGAELLYHFMPDDKFVPYLAAGLGGVNMVGATTFTTTEDARLAPSYGVGAKYFVTDDVAWRIDVRHLMYDYGRFHHSVLYTVGLHIPFGGPPVAERLAPPPPPPPVEPPRAAPAPLPAPSAKLTASPASITQGESSILVWTSQHATGCVLKPGPAAIDTNGSVPVAPAESTTYTLTCTGNGGIVRDLATVSVAPAPPPPPPTVISLPISVPKPSPAAERFCNKPARLMVNFDTDKWDIKPQYHKELKTVGDFLNEFPSSYGEIAGHTDSTHTNAHNMRLSERRANSVKEYIIKHFGIAPERLDSKGYGEDRPIATNRTKAGRAINRRIEANFVCGTEDTGAPSKAAPAPVVAPPAKAPTPTIAPRASSPVSVAPTATPVPITLPAAPAAPSLPAAAGTGKTLSSASAPGQTPVTRATEQSAPPMARTMRAEELPPGSASPPATPKREAASLAQPPASVIAGREPAPTPVPTTTPLKGTPLPDAPPVAFTQRGQESAPATVDSAPFVLNTRAPAPPREGKVAVEGVSIDKNGMSIMTSGKIDDFRMTTLVEGSGLVIDIFGAVNGLDLREARINRFGLLGIRFVDHPDHLQIVLDADREEIIPYRAMKTDDGLRINIKPRSTLRAPESP